MTENSSPEQLLERWRLPARDLAALSFCANSRPATVKAWAESLPATRIAHTGVLLYQALPEICRLKTSAENRLEMLEAVRPYVQQCVQGLAREFLNQPLILPEGPLKTAVVAQALQRHMSAGYCVVLQELSQRAKPGKPVDKRLEVACHRAITSAGLLLLRGYQLYTQIPSNLWLELHGLYRIAEYHGVLDQPVRDNLLKQGAVCSIAQSYLRILLLACARPNQIRQQDVSATYDALEAWCHFARLLPADSQKQDNLFLVNLSADLPPVYKTRFRGDGSEDIRELDLSQLLAALRKTQEQGATSLLEIPTTIQPALLNHLIAAWSITQQRSFPRQPSNDEIEACVGLSNLHSQILGGTSFAAFLGGDDDSESAGGWHTGYQASTGDSARGAPRDNTRQVKLLDKSPGGYCLEWRDAIPSQVRAGEVVGVREKGRHRWALGVIRWVQQQRGATRTGVQLLAPKATPYGAAIEHLNGSFGDYMRVLMLPELKAANQPATLITANVPFQEYNRLQLNTHGELSQVQLTRRIFATGSISQFTFRALGTVDTTGQAAKSDPFTSVWDEESE